MAFQYSILGSNLKEAPPLTMARSIVGVGRDASREEIKKAYWEKAREAHPDHRQDENSKEADKEFGALASAYRLLTNDDIGEKAKSEFENAMRTPFFVGKRLFCLGSLYGVRVYISDADAAITDAGRLIGGGETAAPADIPKEKAVYNMRDSILESQLDDEVETFLCGQYPPEAERAYKRGFMNRSKGGMDDLDWIRKNDIAINHFLERKFEASVYIFKEINQQVLDHIIFMYRFAFCLEALVAQPEYKTKRYREWKDNMGFAIGLYHHCLERIRNRKSYLDQNVNGRIVHGVFNPESMLTVKMQLADAYAEVGEIHKARELWKDVRKTSPSVFEAEEKIRKLSLSGRAAAALKTVKGLLGSK